MPNQLSHTGQGYSDVSDRPFALVDDPCYYSCLIPAKYTITCLRISDRGWLPLQGSTRELGWEGNLFFAVHASVTF